MYTQVDMYVRISVLEITFEKCLDIMQLSFVQIYVKCVKCAKKPREKLVKGSLISCALKSETSKATVVTCTYMCIRMYVPPGQRTTCQPFQ